MEPVIYRLSKYPPHYRYHNFPVSSQGNIEFNRSKCAFIQSTPIPLFVMI
jgi:hypothetical protein